MELISAFGGVGNVGTPGKSFRGYLVATEFCREAHRVIEIVLRANPTMKAWTLWASDALCGTCHSGKGEQRHLDKEHDASEEPSDGNFATNRRRTGKVMNLQMPFKKLSSRPLMKLSWQPHCKQRLMRHRRPQNVTVESTATHQRLSAVEEPCFFRCRSEA